MKTIKKITLFTGVTAVMLAVASITSSNSSGSLVPSDQEAFVNVAESTINGVVSVKSYASPRSHSRSRGSDFFGDPFEFFFGSPNQRRPEAPRSEDNQRQTGLGSGVIISPDGYIVTNNHVIADADRLEVTLNDNRNFVATVIGTDPSTDIALIKIDAEDLHVIPMGNSEDLHVGEWVLAVGNPFGFTSTVTSGIVSAKGRNISSVAQTPTGNNIEAYIQTDAALNAGNSGGALVNLKGELVGINTAIYSQTGNYAGCSFAIPTSIVNKVVTDLKQYGQVQRAVLGIRFGEVTPELVREKDIKGTNAGIYVGHVEERSAAMEAGIQEGDIIVAINGAPTTNTAQLQEAIAKCSPGDTITITYYRDGQKANKKVVLRNGRGGTNISKPGTVAELGCTFANVDASTKQELGISRGVQVTEIQKGPFKDNGIRDGFIILTINDQPVSRPKDIEEIYDNIMRNDRLDKVMFIKGIYPNGKQAYYAIALE